MIDLIEADPERLWELRDRIGVLADEIGGGLDRLEDALAGEGHGWGRDEAGAAFAAAYEPASRSVRSMLATVGANVDELATVLGALIAVLETAECDARRVGA